MLRLIMITYMITSFFAYPLFLGEPSSRDCESQPRPSRSRSVKTARGCKACGLHPQTFRYHGLPILSSCDAVQQYYPSQHPPWAKATSPLEEGKTLTSLEPWIHSDADPSIQRVGTNAASHQQHTSPLQVC